MNFQNVYFHGIAHSAVHCDYNVTNATRTRPSKPIESQSHILKALFQNCFSSLPATFLSFSTIIRTFYFIYYFLFGIGRDNVSPISSRRLLLSDIIIHTTFTGGGGQGQRRGGEGQRGGGGGGWQQQGCSYGTLSFTLAPNLRQQYVDKIFWKEFLDIIDTLSSLKLMRLAAQI